jgi:hypothetical protein
LRVVPRASNPAPASAEAFELVVVEPNAITPQVPVVLALDVIKMYCAVPPVDGIDTIVLAPPKVFTVSAAPPVL